LNNESDLHLKIRASFKEKPDCEEGVNLYWPREGLYTTLKPKAKNVVLAALPKVTASDSGPASEIEKLDITVEV